MVIRAGNSEVIEPLGLGFNIRQMCAVVSDCQQAIDAVVATWSQNVIDCSVVAVCVTPDPSIKETVFHRFVSSAGDHELPVYNIVCSPESRLEDLLEQIGVVIQYIAQDINKKVQLLSIVNLREIVADAETAVRELYRMSIQWDVSVLVGLTLDSLPQNRELARQTIPGYDCFERVFAIRH